MTNPINGAKTININGKAYTFILDMNALCDLEDITGKNAITILGEADNDVVSMKDLRALIFCALKRHHPDITLEEAGDIVGSDFEGAVEALTASFPDKVDSVRGKAKARPRRK